MQVNVLQISTKPAKIDISTVAPAISASYVKPNLDIEKTPAYIDMYSRNISFDMDSSACWAEEGHKTNRMLMADYAQQGMESIEGCTHDTATIGQLMVHAGPGENVYKEVADSDLDGDFSLSGLKFIPSERPTITWNKNQLIMEGHPEKDTYNWTTTNWADVQLERKGSVSITETQKPEFHMDCIVGENSLDLFQSLDQRA